LAETIVSQQLGVAAADSIFARVKEACGGSVSPRSIGRAPARALRKAGLSGAKIKTLKALAAAVRRGAISLPALRHLAEDEATSRLTEIWGIGPWSAEMFLMFSLGRPDVFSPGDLGLARAIEAIYGLPRGAPRARLIAISERWAPYRTFASLALWRSRAAASPPRRPSRKKQGKC
jgi:DNA-3-methyladenine glycosylase II